MVIRNKMVKFKIKTSGFFISIPGVCSFRTPAEISISENKIKLLEAELKKNGITDYKIVKERVESITLPIINKIKSILKIKEDESRIKDEEILSRFNNQQKLIDNNKELINNTTKLLNDFLKYSDKSSERTINKKEKVEDDPVDSFIPSIDLTSSKKMGKSSIEKVITKTNLDNVKSLKDIK